MQLNINTDAAVKFTNTLEKFHKSALPSAIRGALNKAAFDVKTNTLQKSADKSFVKRQPNFFKANSKVEPAQGFNVNTMQAVVGMYEDKLKGNHNYAIKDLTQQEHGGVISKKSFIPLKSARLGSNKNSNVRANFRLTNIRKVVDVNRVNGKSKRSQFTNAMVLAGKNGFVLSGKTLWKVNSIKRKGEGFRKTPLYNFKKGRNIHVHPTNFMKNASLDTNKRMEEYYFAEAKRQIEKYLR